MIKLFVFNTSALISAHLIPNSVSRRAYDLACQEGVAVFSKSTLHEFAITFTREKFEHYQPLEDRINMISLAERRGQLIDVTVKRTVCRDPNDDMFIELAVASQASAIITRDPDLLVLHPFEGIPIFSPADFLKKYFSP